MCGRYTLHVQLSFLADLFGFDKGGLNFAPSYNIAPTQEVLVVIGENNRREAQLMRWGLIPSWAKDPSIGNRMINARAETVSEKPSFRDALRKRRCLVPADGFYEWKRVANRRIPMRIVLKSEEPFAFAGLWEQWRSPFGETIRSCAIITTSANDIMEPIHDRMPVILPKDAWSLWLDTSVQDPARLTELLKPYSSDHMEFYPVSYLVNSPDNDSPEVIAPVPALFADLDGKVSET